MVGLVAVASLVAGSMKGDLDEEEDEDEFEDEGPGGGLAGLGGRGGLGRGPGAAQNEEDIELPETEAGSQMHSVNVHTFSGIQPNAHSIPDQSSKSFYLQCRRGDRTH